MSLNKSEASESKRKYTLEEKQHYVEKWETSNLTPSEFCRQEGLSLQTFCYWMSSRKSHQEKKLPLSFVSVNTQSADIDRQAVEIILPNGLRCRFKGMVEVETLMKIVKELSRVINN